MHNLFQIKNLTIFAFSDTHGKQVRYFRSLPLHSSQEEIETHRDHSVFAYNLAPDYDFKQDILSFGDTIELLEPLSLRESIALIVSNLNDKYRV